MQDILVEVVTLKRIAACRMCGENLGIFGVELDILLHSDVDLHEVVMVERRLQHLSANEDILLLQLTLCAKDIPCCVELHVLTVDRLCFLLTLVLQVSDVVVEIVNGLVKFRDMDILGVELSSQFLELLIFLAHASHKPLNGTFELLTFEAALPELFLQFADKSAVLLHLVSDDLYVLGDLLGFVRSISLAGLSHIDTVLGYVDDLEAILNLVEGRHHVIDLVVALGDDFIERIRSLDILEHDGCLLLSLATSYKKRYACEKHAQERSMEQA